MSTECDRVSNPWREAIEVVRRRIKRRRCWFPILGGRLLKLMFGNLLIGAIVFPILGGRLLKTFPELEMQSLNKVSNPWREAIEGNSKRRDGIL